MPTPRLHVIAQIKAKPEHVDAIRAILEGFVAPTRAESGCFVYDLFQNRSDAGHFTFVEEWLDQESLDAHSKSAHIAQGREKLQGLTLGPAEVVRYSRLA